MPETPAFLAVTAGTEPVVPPKPVEAAPGFTQAFALQSRLLASGPRRDSHWFQALIGVATSIAVLGAWEAVSRPGPRIAIIFFPAPSVVFAASSAHGVERRTCRTRAFPTARVWGAFVSRRRNGNPNRNSGKRRVQGLRRCSEPIYRLHQISAGARPRTAQHHMVRCWRETTKLFLLWLGLTFFQLVLQIRC